MAIVRRENAPTRTWDLGPSFRDVMNEVEPLFGELARPLAGGGSWASGYPVDLYETSDDVVLQMAVPGIAVDDLDVRVEGRQLTIQGRFPEEEGAEGRRYWLQTIPHGELRRTVTLPSQVDLEHVHAKVERGLLTLTLPKAADARARKIDVQVED
jgi:HSP20 family protein